MQLPLGSKVMSGSMSLPPGGHVINGSNVLPQAVVPAMMAQTPMNLSSANVGPSRMGSHMQLPGTTAAVLSSRQLLTPGLGQHVAMPMQNMVHQPANPASPTRFFSHPAMPLTQAQQSVAQLTPFVQAAGPARTTVQPPTEQAVSQRAQYPGTRQKRQDIVRSRSSSPARRDQRAAEGARMKEKSIDSPDSRTRIDILATPRPRQVFTHASQQKQIRTQEDLSGVFLQNSVDTFFASSLRRGRAHDFNSKAKKQLKAPPASTQDSVLFGSTDDMSVHEEDVDELSYIYHMLPNDRAAQRIR